MAKDIPQLQELAGKVWKKEDELKQLKSELSALDRKIQLELAPPISVSEGEENKNNINKSVPEDADVQHRSFTKDCLNIKQLNISEKHKGLKL